MSVLVKDHDMSFSLSLRLFNTAYKDAGVLLWSLWGQKDIQNVLKKVRHKPLSGGKAMAEMFIITGWYKIQCWVEKDLSVYLKPLCRL